MTLLGIIPRGVWLALGAVVVAVALFWMGMAWEAKDSAQEAAQDTADTIERIQDALDAGAGCNWADRLHGACD